MKPSVTGLSRTGITVRRMFETLTLRDTATAGLLALVAVQTARLAWAAVAPIGPLGAAPAPAPEIRSPSADVAVLGRFDPFYRVPVSMGTSAPAAETASFRLFAVRSSGGSASAIIAGADGRQSSVLVGAEVAPGVILASVAGDHVVLSTNGRRSDLFFPTVGSAAPPAAAYTPPPPPAPPPVQPVSAPPAPRAVPEFLAAAGLQPDDQVTSIAPAPDGQGAVIQYQRAGEARTATVGIPSS
jgi:general secretion pathway protein C